MKRTEYTQKWLDALRSGEYPQTELVLKDENGYCCLGVAAEIMSLDLDGDVYPALRKGFGMDAREQGYLINLNDGEGRSFNEIADAIEGMLDVS